MLAFAVYFVSNLVEFLLDLLQHLKTLLLQGWLK
jgi:hypothetical protein